MPIVQLPKSYLLSNVSGLSTGLCIGLLSNNYIAAFAGGAAVSLALYAFKDAMREVVRESQPGRQIAPTSPPETRGGGFDGKFEDMHEVSAKMARWPITDRQATPAP